MDLSIVDLHDFKDLNIIVVQTKKLILGGTARSRNYIAETIEHFLVYLCAYAGEGGESRERITNGLSRARPLPGI